MTYAHKMPGTLDELNARLVAALEAAQQYIGWLEDYGEAVPRRPEMEYDVRISGFYAPVAITSCNGGVPQGLRWNSRTRSFEEACKWALSKKIAEAEGLAKTYERRWRAEMLKRAGAKAHELLAELRAGGRVKAVDVRNCAEPLGGLAVVFGSLGDSVALDRATDTYGPKLDVDRDVDPETARQIRSLSYEQPRDFARESLIAQGWTPPPGDAAR